MSELTCTDNVLESIKQRRTGGENLAKLAGEVGLTWQKLWTMLYPMPQPARRPALKATGHGPLTEKYRPHSLRCLWGQEKIVKLLRKFAENPHPTAMLFEGATGTGKTSAALALAAELGCNLKQKEFGGVHVIASGEQSAEAVRDTTRQMWNTPFYGSGWKVVIVNEADRMHLAAETVWLDRLEALPARTVVIFTTNFADKLSPRFRDRCTRLRFESDAGKLQADAEAFAAAVWKAETGRKAKAGAIGRIVDAASVDGEISFRRVMQELTVALSEQEEQQ